MDQIKQGHLVLFFCLLALLFRVTSFMPMVIDHDESTYIIIADEWIKGHLPYVERLDVKPIGIYIAFAAFLSVVKSVWFIRFMTALLIGVSAYLIHHIYQKLFHNRSHSIIAGALYILLISLHKWGWSANTEIYFVFFSVLALWQLLRATTYRQYITLGIILGIGMLFKYHIIFDILALVLFDFFRHKKWRSWFGRWTIAFLGFLTPYALTALSYRFSNHLDAFVFATVEIPLQYSSKFSMVKALNFLGEFFISFAPVSILYFATIYYLIKDGKISRPTRILLLSWSLIAWIGILSTGKLYFHYYIQFLPVFCISSVLFLDLRQYQNIERIWSKRKIATFTLVALLILVNGNQYMQLFKRSDPTSSIANLIKETITDTDYIYTNDKNILYFLCDARIPTKYVHTSLLYKDDLSAAYEINQAEEFQKIIDTKPAYIVLRDKVPTWQGILDREYQLLRQFSEIMVHQRIQR